MTTYFDRVVEVDFIPANSREFTIKGLRVQFDIEKTVNLAPNKANVKIYNMNPTHRGAAQFRYDLESERYGAEIRVRAGYGSELKQIFRGHIIQAVNYKRGPDWVTEIESMMFLREILKSKITRATPYNKGTPIFQILKDVILELGIPVKGKWLNLVEARLAGAKTKKSVTLYGSAADILNDLSRGLDKFININFDDDGVNMLRVGEAVNAIPEYIGPRSGLLGTPEITIKGCDIKTLLRHDIKIGTQYKVTSDTVNSLETSGKYVAYYISHTGDSREGEFVTKIKGVFPLTESNIYRE